MTDRLHKNGSLYLKEKSKILLFGTDGIRGVANTYPMTPELAIQAGRAIVYYLRKGKLGLVTNFDIIHDSFHFRGFFLLSCWQGLAKKAYWNPDLFYGYTSILIIEPTWG